MPSETTRTEKNGLVTFSRYSWGGGMDHSEGWTQCARCGVVVSPSDDDADLPGDEWDAYLSVHTSGFCILLAWVQNWALARNHARRVEEVF